MGKPVVTITHPDGTKKVLVGKRIDSKPIKTREVKTDVIPDKTGRAKPVVGKAGLTREKNAYKYGGRKIIK